MKILITADYFYPSKRGSGPIRSLVNFVDKFAGVHEIYLVTRDRDAANLPPYQEIQQGIWNHLLGIQVRYLSPNESIRRVLCESAREIQPDTIYMNSICSPLTRSILQSAARRSIPRTDLLIAVRGELNPAALAIKPVRKQIYLRAGLAMGLFRGARFHASTEAERTVIKEWFPKHTVEVATDVPESVQCDPRHRPTGVCRFAFTSRIAPIKNLEVALAAFEELVHTQSNFQASFEIHGEPIDESYGDAIRSRIARCRGKANYHGPFLPSDVWSILEQSTFTVLPSRGENFAHAVYESAAMGIPFLISDRTPWTEAANTGCGWVNCPDDQAGWKDAMIQAYQMSSDAYAVASRHCIDSARKMREIAHEQHERLFQSDRSATQKKVHS